MGQIYLSMAKQAKNVGVIEKINLSPLFCAKTNRIKDVLTQDLTPCIRRAKLGAFELSAGVNSGTDLPQMDRFLRKLGFQMTGGNYSLVLGGGK